MVLIVLILFIFVFTSMRTLQAAIFLVASVPAMAGYVVVPRNIIISFAMPYLMCPEAFAF